MITKQTVLDQLAKDQERLFNYLRIPTISAQKQNIGETVAFLQRTFSELGADKVVVWDDVVGANPFVFAEFVAGPKGNADKTVLFYNHYDVQPPEPLAEWHSDPFEPVIKDGKLICRGVSDDKGDLMSRLSAIKVLMDNGGLPCNLKFMVEGSEEIGSPEIETAVIKHQTELATDAIIWESGGKNENEQFQISCGVKGALTFEMKVKTADVDMHSSKATFAPNAAWRLVHALSSLKDVNNHILVPGFYDDMIPLTDRQRATLGEVTFNEAEIKRTLGLKQLIPAVTTPKEDLVNEPTLTINGLSSGYEGAGVKTIVPKEATVKIGCRLVPNQTPKQIFDLIVQFLHNNGFEDVEATYLVGEDPFRSDIEDPFVQLAKQTADQVYGQSVLEINSAGSGPEAPFGNVLNAPIVSAGIGYSHSGPHAPNEHVRVQDFEDATLFMVNWLAAFGK